MQTGSNRVFAAIGRKCGSPSHSNAITSLCSASHCWAGADHPRAAMGSRHVMKPWIAPSSRYGCRMRTSENAAANPGAALRTQVDLLRTYSQLFDSGTEDLALPMATALRVLLHDTKVSISVFKQLGVKDKILFTDTASPIIPGNLLPWFGLVISEVTVGEGGRYVASSASGAPPSRVEPSAIPFEKWWNTPLSVDVDRNRWSRRRMVKVVTDKLGGAHVDPNVAPAEVKLNLPDAFGWTVIGPRGEAPFGNSPLPPSIRQIAYEVLDTVGREQLLDAR